MWSNIPEEYLEEITLLQELLVEFIEKSKTWNPEVHGHELCSKTDTPIELIIMVNNFIYLLNEIINLLNKKNLDQPLKDTTYEDLLYKFGSGSIGEILNREYEISHKEFIELKVWMIDAGIFGRLEELDANYETLSSIIDDSGIIKKNHDYSIPHDLKRAIKIFYEPIDSWSQFSGRLYSIRWYLRRTLESLGRFCGYSPNFS
jgi:hypothetical protein|tara:strand:- start:476 stop:1084 length:609 start_codon:yes stop_codon:yes gene_type:complete